MSKVALIRCGSYDYNEVKAAVQKGIDLLGGSSIYARKPNWIMAVPPEKAATTHPMVFKAVAEIFKKEGVNLTYGDSPGFSTPENAAQKTGFADVASGLGIALADFHNGKEVFFKEALQNRK